MLLFIRPVNAVAQTTGAGSIEFLKERPGFHNIILGNDLAQVDQDKLEYMDGDKNYDADSCLKYTYRDTSIVQLTDEVILNSVAFRTYKNKIINIYAFFKLEDGNKVLRLFLADYGVFTNKPDDYSDIYNWETSKVNLTLRYQRKLDLGVAIFTDNQLQKKMEQDKINCVNDNSF